MCTLSGLVVWIYLQLSRTPEKAISIQFIMGTQSDTQTSLLGSSLAGGTRKIKDLMAVYIDLHLVPSGMILMIMIRSQRDTDCL